MSATIYHAAVRSPDLHRKSEYLERLCRSGIVTGIRMILSRLNLNWMRTSHRIGCHSKTNIFWERSKNYCNVQRREKISSQLSLYADSPLSVERQCPDCKSRKGFYRLSTSLTEHTRHRRIICMNCATVHCTIEEYPDGFNPRKKYKVYSSWASTQARHRAYWVAYPDRTKGFFDTLETFDNALPQHKTIDTRRS